MSSPSIWSPGASSALLASRHKSTGQIMFPPYAEGSPLNAAHERIELQGEGTVYSFTVIHPNPKSGEQPFALGYVDLPGPVRIFGRLQGKHRPAIGDRYRAVPDAAFGYVFSHVEGSAQ
ncbi:OB-fold domain-containing protein [Variovorax sp. J22R133]|uniref:Zn-ribbon domain-containing OB-fold protein n=1 Tax=Variovorax brevis TaxID=3053503 RepID=UPI002578AE4D|nr:OB-fold domain-containing protein [Variovorax sp. J22R133]MDM0117021.1 OB-fold domain-containing protein [Variovorax sp. J22R133]